MNIDVQAKPWSFLQQSSKPGFPVLKSRIVIVIQRDLIFKDLHMHGHQSGINDMCINDWLMTGIMIGINDWFSCVEK